MLTCAVVCRFKVEKIVIVKSTSLKVEKVPINFGYIDSDLLKL